MKTQPCLSQPIQEGQNATVELHHTSALLAHLPQYEEMVVYPGPLVPGETHKNDVIKFCERKMADARHRRLADKDSYILIWDMLILLLRQKGQVEGSDVADLLLKVGEEPGFHPRFDVPTAVTL